jgi:hypothetical protein
MGNPIAHVTVKNIIRVESYCPVYKLWRIQHHNTMNENHPSEGVVTDNVLRMKGDRGECQKLFG